MTEILRLQYDDRLPISFIGADDHYYDAGGPLVISEVHTPRVSAKDLDILEIASHGKIVFTTDSTNKALEIGGFGALDPNILDTTVLDAGSHGLKLASDVDVSLSGSSVTLLGRDSLYMTLDPSDGGNAFHHYADRDGLLIGIGKLGPDPSTTPLTGSFFEATADSFTVRSETARIASTASGRTRYETTVAHEFFVGTDAASASDHAGVFEITPDKVTIRGDVDLIGTINSVNETSSTLELVDRLITLAHSSDPDLGGRDAFLTGPVGLAIDTVPSSYTEDGPYMARFLDAAGNKLFVDDATGTIDTEKARLAGIFSKGILYDIRSGMRVAGGQNAESRSNEPVWEVTGGSFHVARFVPSESVNGLVNRFSMGFRIRDDGTFEMVRVVDDYQWDDETRTYIRHTDRRAEVVATYS